MDSCTTRRRVAWLLVSQFPTLLRALRTIRDLPHIVVARTASPAGDEIARRTRQTLFGRTIRRCRYAQSVLPIPADLDAYMKGKRRHPVRKNIRKAHELGITCRQLNDVDEWRVFAAAVVAVPIGTLEEDVANSVRVGARHEWFGAFDPDGRPLALATLTLDRQTAILHRFQSAVGTEEFRSPARYQLHYHLLELLSKGGIEHLLAANYLTLTAGLQYYQKRIGFEPFNVSSKVVA